MCSSMKRIICLCALFFGVVWVLSPFAAAAENWPMKKFTIVEKDNLTETFIGPVDVTTPLALKMEQNNLTPTQEKVIVDWLEEVANYFEKQGFPPPRYEEKTDKELIVYAYPFGAKNDPTALAYPDCKNPSKNTFIHLDPKRIFNQSTGKITTKGYQDLAHELFHTVQYAYPMFQKSPCGQSPGAWITEGTAEAVGIETARRLKGIQPEHVCQMGLRPYLKSLFVYSKDPVDKCGMRAYNTQSFWQFLGEYSTRKGFIATEEFAQPDFRYLHNFFSTSHAMGA